MNLWRYYQENPEEARTGAPASQVPRSAGPHATRQSVSPSRSHREVEGRGSGQVTRNPTLSAPSGTTRLRTGSTARLRDESTHLERHEKRSRSPELHNVQAFTRSRSSQSLSPPRRARRAPAPYYSRSQPTAMPQVTAASSTFSLSRESSPAGRPSVLPPAPISHSTASSTNRSRTSDPRSQSYTPFPHYPPPYGPTPILSSGHQTASPDSLDARSRPRATPGRGYGVSGVPQQHQPPVTQDSGYYSHSSQSGSTPDRVRGLSPSRRVFEESTSTTSRHLGMFIGSQESTSMSALLQWKILKLLTL